MFVVVITKVTLNISSTREEHISLDLVCLQYANQHRSKEGLYDTKLFGRFVVTMFSSKVDVKVDVLNICL
jgi:hypothetical protein